jgi:hypothetical protein
MVAVLAGPPGDGNGLTHQFFVHAHPVIVSRSISQARDQSHATKSSGALGFRE